MRNMHLTPVVCEEATCSAVQTGPPVPEALLARKKLADAVEAHSLEEIHTFRRKALEIFNNQKGLLRGAH